MGKFKMKGSTLYGKLKLNRDGYENLADGRSKSSAFQDKKGTGWKGKLKAAAQTAKEVGSAEYDLGDISQNYKANKMLIRKAKAEGGKPNFKTMKVDKSGPPKIDEKGSTQEVKIEDNRVYQDSPEGEVKSAGMVRLERAEPPKDSPQWKSWKTAYDKARAKHIASNK